MAEFKLLFDVGVSMRKAVSLSVGPVAFPGCTLPAWKMALKTKKIHIDRSHSFLLKENSISSEVKYHKYLLRIQIV